MGKVKNENYIVIQGFMINELNLKGNELLVYAIIYGFSQTENQRFTGGLQYLADWTNSSKQGVIKNLKSLVEKGYIVKEDKVINGIKFCEYYVTELNGVLNKVEQGIKQSLMGGIKQSLINNIYNNNNIYSSSDDERQTDLSSKKDNNTIANSENFDKIWAIYPKKTAKGKAYQFYAKWLSGNRYLDKKIKLTNRQIYSAVSKYKQECEKNNRDKQYILAGSTFFNQRIMDYVELEE